MTPEHRPAEATADESDEWVACNAHGKGNAAFICGHLAAKPTQLWFSDRPSEADPCPDAWCGLCNMAFWEQGEWNDANDGCLDVKVVCHRCYEEMRGRSVRL